MDDAKVAPTPREQLAAPPEPAPGPSTPEMEPFQVGWWDGYPNYGCPYCLYLTLDGSRAVEEHIHQSRTAGSPAIILQHMDKE